MSDTKGQEVLWQAGERLKTNKKNYIWYNMKVKGLQKKKYYISQSLDQVSCHTLNLTNILLEFWAEFLSHLHYLRILQCSNHKKNKILEEFYCHLLSYNVLHVLKKKQSAEFLKSLKQAVIRIILIRNVGNSFYIV